MLFKHHDRQFDVVLLGATGYTGSLTAEHIATSFPINLKWAVAGRSAEKLQKLVSKCQALKPDRFQPAIEVCNVNDEDLAALARKAFCLITTLGPYARYGEYAFKACAEAGTHYLDCTGEVPFTMFMIEKYEAIARATGACMFPQSGLESAPSDLLTWALVSAIRTGFSSKTSDVIMDLHRLDSVPTGGTLESLLNMIEVFPVKVLLNALKPYALSPVQNDHPSPKKSLATFTAGLIKPSGLGLLSTSPTGAMNAALVFRTWGLSKQEPSFQEWFYGPRFTYREFMRAPNALAGIMMHYGLFIAATLLLCSPVRALIRKLIFKPGEGPDKRIAKEDCIEFRAVAKPDVESKTDQQAFGKFSYTGSMYYLTAILLAQGAARILQDNTLKLTGGIYTPACLGQGYIDNLKGCGVQIETEIQSISR